MIPLCDLKQQYASLKEEIDEAMQQVAADAVYILGPNVKAFEQEMAHYAGSRFAVGVGSGTDALALALRALQIGPGDEVITTPFTFIGTTEAICLVGATPVFVDIDPSTFNIDVSKIEDAITPQTKVILPVHLYGQPCEMDQIVDIASRHGLDIVEDCAQAVGATYKGQKVGTFGKAGCLSFFPSKNLGCFGDGGMILTNDEQVYERAEMLRRHGGKVKYHHTELGLNSRLDELQAAVLRVKLPYLESWNERRSQIAYRYNQLLAECSGIVCPKEIGEVIPGGHEDRRVRSVYHQYTLRIKEREHVAQSLRESGVGCAVYYPIPLHLQEVHSNLGYAHGDFPEAEKAACECLSIPIFPELNEAEQNQVVCALMELNAFCEKTTPVLVE